MYTEKEGKRIWELYSQGIGTKAIIEKMVKANYTQEYAEKAVDAVVSNAHDGAIKGWK